MRNQSLVFLALFSLSFILMFGRNIVLAKPGDKVTICHATESETNPYEQIVVSENAIGAHFENPGTPKSGHEDDLFFYGEVECPGGSIPTLTPTDRVEDPTNTPTLEPTQRPTGEPEPTNTLVPTPTNEPGTIEEGNIDLPCILGCPTSSATPTPTLTPTPTITANPTVTPTPEPATGGTSTASSTGDSSSSSTSNPSSTSTSGSVLGTTTLAATGSLMSTMASLVLFIGLFLMGASTLVYVNEKKVN